MSDPYSTAPAPAPRSGLSTAAKVAIAAVAVVVIGLIGVGGFGAFMIGAIASDHLATLKVLDKVRNDNNGIGAQLKQSSPISASAFSGSNPDFATMQKTIKDLSAQFVSSGTTLNADLKSLRTEDARIKGKETSIQGSLGRTQYETDRRRVESATGAFVAGGELLGVLEHQFAYYDKLAAALVAFDAMTAKASTTPPDLAGALALYPPLDAAIGTSVSAASDPSVSPQHKALTTALQTIVADFKALLVAAQAQDSAAAQAALSKIQTDQTAFTGFDDKAFQAWEAALLKPYQDRYDKGLRGAGWTVTA
ncbi:MAG: hypothetical protein M3Z98_04570 [Candidatus Dormibacteraeota bacterium]|nr:hypothetical protein [Candidatus Dormibacteraeota bacterium]